MTVYSFEDWTPGDRYGLAIPAHPDALREGGAAFLTRAMRAAGSLDADNAVARITRCDDLLIGGTGAKVVLSLVYDRPDPSLPTELFIKFSRNRTDRTRDRVRFHMEPEVKLANLSREPAFPVTVPRCLFADFQLETGTGILITERIAFGQGKIEPHFEKSQDHRLPEPLDHYRAILSSLASLSGSHKAGLLGPSVEQEFPFELESAVAARRNPFDADGVAMRVERLAQFVRRFPHLFPPEVTEPAFLDSWQADARNLLAVEEPALRRLLGSPDTVALCHWNGNIDNAWFWRDANGALCCGLIDWGSVGQMSLAQTVWGSLSCAEVDFLDAHFADLVAYFAAEYTRFSGLALDPGRLMRDLEMHIAVSGVSASMVSPRAILHEVPDPDQVSGPRDPAFDVNETARVHVRVITSLLTMWHRRDLGRWLRPETYAD